MTKKHLYFIAVLFAMYYNYSLAQQDCQVPLNPPVLTYVSVQPETGLTYLEWTPSPDPNIAAYIIYTYMEDQGSRGDPVDTLWSPTATSYSYINPGYRYFNTSYVVTAWRSPRCEGPFSNILSTIYAEAQADPCLNRIDISWNKYSSYPVKVTGYNVLTSVNSGPYNLAGHVTENDTSFVMEDIINEANYCFIVNAILENGRVSVSNRSCVEVKIQNPPGWINADYATVTEEGAILLSFHFDPSSEIDLFSIERKSGYSGSFEEIAPVRVNLNLTNSITHLDGSVKKDSIYFYRLSAINNCEVPIVISNLASNIVLDAQNTGDEIILQWNQYQDWNGSVSSYRLFMDTGSGIVETALITPPDTIFRISIPDIMHSLSQGRVCFYIIASESGNPYGINGESSSNQICSEIEEVITVPNIFTPDGDLINDLFRPVLTFTPSDYRLIINNRQGKVIFETNDPMDTWDGSDNGDPVTEGVYLWFLRVTTPSGKRISRTGTLTIVKN